MIFVCMYVTIIKIMVKVKNPIPPTRRPTRRSTVGRQSVDCQPTVDRRVDNYLIL